MPTYTIPGLDESEARAVADELQARLASLLDLQLVLKHAHWNVEGPNFIAVHEMLDPQVLRIREMTDAVAERLATIGGQPRGTAADIAEQVPDRYPAGRASTDVHLRALDARYASVTAGHRAGARALDGLDPVSQDLLIGQSADLELFHWFIRSHLVDEPLHLGEASPPPSADEARAAERAEVPASTGEHYREMAKIGADVEGEGAI